MCHLRWHVPSPHGPCGFRNSEIHMATVTLWGGLGARWARNYFYTMGPTHDRAGRWCGGSKWIHQSPHKAHFGHVAGSFHDSPISVSEWVRGPTSMGDVPTCRECIFKFRVAVLVIANPQPVGVMHAGVPRGPQ